MRPIQIKPALVTGKAIRDESARGRRRHHSCIEFRTASSPPMATALLDEPAPHRSAVAESSRYDRIVPRMLRSVEDDGPAPCLYWRGLGTVPDADLDIALEVPTTSRPPGR
jgi:hypothetical protein